MSTLEEDGVMGWQHLVKEFQASNGGSRTEVEVEEVEEEEEEEEVWPVEHPVEPMDEDRPVICPIPTSSLLPQEGRRSGDEKKKVESWRKRAENPVAIAAAMPIMINNNVDRLEVAAADRSIGVVRKRHHTHSSSQRAEDSDDYRNHDHYAAGDYGLRRSMTLPLPSNSNVTNTYTIFHMLQRAPYS